MTLHQFLHYYEFFRTYFVHSYFHTRKYVSLYFSFSITKQDSPVPFSSLFRTPVTSTPIATYPVNRFPIYSSQRPHKTLILTILVSINDASIVLHFHSALRNSTDRFYSAFSYTLSTIPFGYSTYRCFATFTCMTIAEDLPPS